MVNVQPLPILNIFVLHVGQVPEIAGLPFFMVTGFGFFISLFVLHFTQYPVVISILRPYSLIYNYAIKGYITLIFTNLIKTLSF